MKKIAYLLAVFMISIVLGGCSLLGEVNDSIDYINTTTDHIDNLSAFAEEAPQMIESAVTDPAVREELETKLVTMKEDIEEYIGMTDIPAVAEDIHQEFVAKNEVLLEEINAVLENGHLALDKIENSELVQTANDVTSLLERIESLGQ